MKPVLCPACGATLTFLWLWTVANPVNFGCLRCPARLALKGVALWFLVVGLFGCVLLSCCAAYATWDSPKWVRLVAMLGPIAVAALVLSPTTIALCAIRADLHVRKT